MMECSSDHYLRQYLEARNYLDVEVVRLTKRRHNPADKVSTVKEFNKELGNPQSAYPSIQIAGTSGKGSTAVVLSNILTSSGARTGLHISPYLQVATEKTWLDGSYCSADEFFDAYQAIRPVTEQYRDREDCPASVHGMASLALSYEFFRRRMVDWCVMETGVGGRFDLVQGLDRRLSIITDIGLDHTKTLGETVQEIAWHKAGIMAGAEITIAVRNDRIWPVFVAEAERQDCRLEGVVPEERSRHVISNGRPTLVIELPRLGSIDLPWPHAPDSFVSRNAVLAACAADTLVSMGVSIDSEAVRKGLLAPGLPGRLEVIQKNPEVILDGAHNHQKISALMDSLPIARKRHLVLAASGERDLPGYFDALSTPPASITLTRPLLFGQKVVPPEKLARAFEGTGIPVRIEPTPLRAMQTAIANADPEDQILVTGSLYLVGQVRNRWYPWQQVLLQQTSWPGLHSKSSQSAP